ncbi:histone-lysine N-methyltransferase SETDB1-like isoform X2 [Mya arenaria]|uniref:histone-lysine N-methyltransferase SETDB1-like isoform X2 n=1 Tax=Mya arenaria TaxID=6604 RepID=UPI0022E0E993|nr:histone-lysine N-methyltransferase SETDB1-like isoform X2 [Mya arenaria]
MATSGEDVIPSSFVREYKISNYYCCVYDCNSNGRYDSEISFHKFPKDENIRKQWVVKIRRDIGNDFQISKTTVVCCKHFKTEDYVGWTPSKTRRLKKGIVPSVFDWSEEKTARRLLTRKPTATSQPKTKRLRLDGADHSTLTSDEQPGGSGEDILTATPLHIEQHREIDMLKDQLQKKTEECSNVNKQLAVMSVSEEDGRMFQISDSLDLDSLVDSVIDEICNPDSTGFQADIHKVQNQIRNAERKQREINRIFSDCMEQLVQFSNTLEEEERHSEQRHQEILDAEANGPSEVTITDSDEDDDDVQFIQKTFDPNIALKRKQEASASNSGIKRKTDQPSTIGQTRANLAAALANSPQSVLHTVPKNNLQPLQRNLQPSNTSLSSPSSQLSSLLSSPPSVLPKTVSSVLPMAGSQSATPSVLSALQQRKPASSSYMQSSQANQEHMEKLFLEDVNVCKVGGYVLARRYGDVWQKAEIMDINKPATTICDRKFKVRFEQKRVVKMLVSKHVAFLESINKPVLVGTRIIALYKDDESNEAFYAGIIAEAPNGRNELRYLVFFDDGYAQYCSSKEIHKVFYQSRNVWEDIHPDSQDFVKDYLAQYPERPMVRLHKGQTVKTEWKGKWWTAKVEEVDASLVLMFFPADKRSEWIYRGSTRLEPLYTALANAEANRIMGKVKRHNLNVASGNKPVVEYTRNNSTDSSPAKAEKKKSVAKKSTTPSSLNTGQVWEASWMKRKSTEDRKPSLKIQPQDKFSTSTISSPPVAAKSRDMASILQDRLTTPEEAGTVDLESLGTRLDHIIPSADRKKVQMVPHKCSKKCLKEVVDHPDKYRGNNPLLIPLFFGWERHVAKTKPYGRRVVFYRAPCGRRIRNLEELDLYLMLTDSQLPIDAFCCDPELHVHYEFIPVKTFCDIKDISYGKENVVISCVNGIDRQYPDYVDYSNQRIPASGVKLNLDPNFLVCCDCEDNCRDPSKCACQQLTSRSSAVVNGGRAMPNAGYRHRRLEEPLISGLYECNSRCKCDKRCVQRVVQNGLKNRLQVFKTEKRGWGLRCLDDIPRGGFICIYAGQLLTDQGANEDGQQYGDEYLAELDYIEVVERQKAGYESDVEDIDEMGRDNDGPDWETESDHGNGSDSDESFKDKSYTKKGWPEVGVSEKQHQTRASDRDVKRKQTAQKSTSGSRTSPELPDLNTPSITAESSDKKKRIGRSTGARYGPINHSSKKEDEKEEEDEPQGPSTRDYFEDDQSCYIMDAKSMGNIGRYLNHSCQPNAFVQNVFVDTHDLRFPWIAFFAGQYISAGSELTWDYNYEVGSVHGKVLYCYCGSAECRGRLL